MRLLLVLVVVIAICVLLWGSWQWGRRPFYLTVSAVIIGLLILLAGIYHNSAGDQTRMPPDDIRVVITDIRNAESGVRLSGTVANDGELDVAELTLQAQALSCEGGTDTCEVIHQENINLAMFVPAGRSYPFAVASRYPDEDTPVDRWQLRPVDKLVYPE